MAFRFIKNIQFTKLIKADGRLKEFNFTKPNGLEQGVFSVDVIDERGARIIFSMEKVDNTWTIVKQPLPDWILEKEKDFNEFIEEELKLLSS